jgi:hypothetical protein
MLFLSKFNIYIPDPSSYSSPPSNPKRYTNPNLHRWHIVNSYTGDVFFSNFAIPDFFAFFPLIRTSKWEDIQAFKMPINTCHKSIPLYISLNFIRCHSNWKFLTKHVHFSYHHRLIAKTLNFRYNNLWTSWYIKTIGLIVLFFFFSSKYYLIQSCPRRTRHWRSHLPKICGA